MSLRSCRPCHTSKIRCTREVPHCQTCVKRGKCWMCVYEASVPDRKRVSDRKPALPEPQPKRQLQKQERASGELEIRWRATEPQPEQSLRHKKSTNEKMQHAIEPTKEADNKDLDQRFSGRTIWQLMRRPQRVSRLQFWRKIRSFNQNMAVQLMKISLNGREAYQYHSQHSSMHR